MFGVMVTKENKFARKIKQDLPLCDSHVCFQSPQDMRRKSKLLALSKTVSECCMDEISGLQGA